MPSDVAEALKFISELKDEIYSGEQTVIDGRWYAQSRNLTPIKDPEMGALSLNTLTSLVDFIGTLPEGDSGRRGDRGLLLHVQSPTKVAALSSIFGPFRQRESYATASPEIPDFTFDTFMSTESFIIGLNACFIQNKDRDDLLHDVAKIRVGIDNTIEDDGVSQTVSMAAGAKLLDRKTTKLRATLVPWSTFHEVPQPEREFIFRLSDKGQPGLFVADGNAWRHSAMQSIKEWLQDQLPGVQVIA